MHSSRSATPRAVTMMEVMIVVVVIGVFAALGSPGLSAMVTTHKIQQQQALVALAVRENKAIALEQGIGVIIKPSLTVQGVVIQPAIPIGAPGTDLGCTEVGTPQTVATPDLVVAGDTICFEKDGTSGDSIPKLISFTPLIGDAAIVSVVKEGTIAWSGTSLSKTFLDAEVSLSISTTESSLQTLSRQ